MRLLLDLLGTLLWGILAPALFYAGLPIAFACGGLVGLVGLLWFLDILAASFGG